MQGESSPVLVNPTVVLHDSSCKTGVYNTIHLFIIFEREGVAVWIERNRKQSTCLVPYNFFISGW